MITNQEWKYFETPQEGDTLKWIEPIWAAPNRPRGKRDKIGEQEITAKLINITDILELKVISVNKILSNDIQLSVKENDEIKRKQSSLIKGDCRVLLGL